MAKIASPGALAEGSIEERNPASLRPYARNARQHPVEQIAPLAVL